MEDEHLVREFLRGADREEACNALVRKYWRVLVGWVRIRVRNSRDAEEIVQDTFTRAFRSLDTLESPGSFAAWVFRIAGNLAADFLRKRRPAVSLDELVEEGRAPSFGVRVEDDLERAEDVDRVLEALASLPERYRTVLTLRYLEGMSAKAIAARLGEPEGTIRNRVFRALRKLRGMLERAPVRKTETGEPGEDG